MTDAIEDFLTDLHQRVSLAASEEGNERGLPETFTQYMADVLTDAGEIDGAMVAPYQASGARASGFSLSEDESTLWLFLTDYRGKLDVEGLGKTDLEAHFRRMTTFLERARDGLWKKLEESSASWDMAHRLAEVWGRVGDIRLVVLTNAVLRTQVAGQSTLDHRPVHHVVWDLSRLHKLETSGRAQEPIVVNIPGMGAEPIPCIGPYGEPGAYSSYFLVIPGPLLAKIYADFGPRLLELNVRSFLQSRGKVNRGIQDTLKNEPARFLAYNNGISMTAAAVKCVDLSDGSKAINEISDLQIVNGGQTTASLHYAMVKSKVDLSQVFVQAKLSVVDSGLLMDLVPRISEYANSQNKVNTADFSANDPFHIEIERFSRTVWAPGKGGTSDMTRWFYERARGQYADAHARERTPAKQRQFKAINPLNQKFTKTDLAKFENTWDQLPWIVALGAEKNFREFTLRLEKRGSKFIPDQSYFENLIAKAIIFKTSEKLVGALKLGGYRSQTVTYTISKILHATGQRIDLRSIYKSQEISGEFIDAITDLAPVVHAAIVSSAGTRNVGEWAKKEDCWKAVLDIEWKVPRALASKLEVGTGRTATTATSSIGEQLTGEETQSLATVMSVEADTWFAMSRWGKETDALTPWQRNFAFNIGRKLKSGGTPSRKQIIQAREIVTEARRLGFDA